MQRINTCELAMTNSEIAIQIDGTAIKNNGIGKQQ